jgi:putative membrane-bound dehydrogenase-like protein
MRSLLLTIAALLALSPYLCAQANVPGLKVPSGFEVKEFADGKLANDIYCLTVDPQGRVVVSGRRYIRILVDDDGDGRADRAIDFAAEPKDGAMGLLWEGDSLYVTGDGGLRRFRVKNGDRPDGPSELIRAMKTGGEHSSHAIRRGPDGWLYVLGGNAAGIGKSYAELPTSPVKDPTAGCVLRFQPDLKKCEIFAHGFRNPYGMDFNLDGELFTFDSDNERCVSLPWYEPTRFYHVIAGGHYGWLNPQHASFWRRPPYFGDVIPPVATLGRGSPTGVACYGHNQFPPEYQGGFFLCDWTFGKIHFAAVERQGASYTAKTRVFLESQGDNGFAPTACAVDPKTGDLYVSIGGRGTRGAVYRIRHTERFKSLKNELSPLKAVVRPLEKSAIFDPKAAIALLDRSQDPADILKAIRGVQLDLGDIGARTSIGTIWEGYTTRQAIKESPHAGQMAAMFPSGNPDVDFELARTLGMLAHPDDKVRLRVLGRCTAQSSPIDAIHFLACYARLGGKRGAKEANTVAGVLLDLDRKITMRKLNRDSNWPLRVRELYDGLSGKDPTLPEAMVAHPAFGRPEHALFAGAPNFPRERAARIMLQRWQRDPQYALNGNIVQLLMTLPAGEVLPTVRSRWGETGQEASLLPLIARQPTPADRTRLVDGLKTHQPAILEACVLGLNRLAGKAEPQEIFALTHALHRSSDKQTSLRKLLAGRLETITGEKLGGDSKRWIAWMEQHHPEFGRRLANPDGVDVKKWDQRLSHIDWAQGNAERGQVIYGKASCSNCHSGGNAVGPDLLGVTKRFSRADLFTAILQPSKDVPARYQTTVVETSDGKTYQGIVIYDAVDSLILQTGAATTVRLQGASVASRFVSPQSLMPAGLLDPLTDPEIADLYTYLRDRK